VNVVTVVEIDVPRCQLTYGVAPCAAVLGTTGDRKCFNSRATCQDLANYDPASYTLRFVRPSADVEAFDAIPSLAGVSVTPQVINPGVDLGQRESVSLSFVDHPDSDALFDKYIADRGYNPYNRGTFWGRFRARFPTLKGRALRVYRGESGQALADMRVWHYVIDSTAGPAQGKFAIVAKDALKLADGDTAQAPQINTGTLLAPLAAGATSATLSPAGIGNLEYPASGKCSIGGNEVCEFTRADDVLTLVRGQSNTEDKNHDEDELVQVGLIFDAQRPSDILYDLFTIYTDIDPAWLPLADWQAEVDTFLGRLFGAEIYDPTDVKKLANELIEQCGLVIWTDTETQRVELRVLRPVSSTVSVIDTTRMVLGSYKAQEQPSKRVSEVWTYFGLVNPLAKLDDRNNYRSAAVDFDHLADDAEPVAIKKIFSRWIQLFNRSAAERLNSLQIARYSKAPRKFSFELWRTDPAAPAIGTGTRLEHFELQDDTGADTIAPAQVISYEFGDDTTALQAEEMLFAADVEGKSVTIDVDAFNVNLRDLYDEFYTPPAQYEAITFRVLAGVTVGSVPGKITIPQSPYNWDFESGDTGWVFTGFGSHRIDTTDPVDTGTWSMKLGWEDNPNAQALFATSTARIAVNPGDVIQMASRVISEATGSDYARIMPQICWYDAGGSLLSFTEMPPDSTIVGGEPRINVSGLSTAAANLVWVTLTLLGVAPAGAAFWGPRIKAAWGDAHWTVDGINAEISVPTEIRPAMEVGDWPELPTLSLIVEGDICGAGGEGGDGKVPVSGGRIVAQPGRDGGTGLKVRYPIAITNTGSIRGGGGGGGGCSSGGATTYGRPGGGGAGVLGGDVGEPNSGAFPGAPGTKDAGGAGNTSNTTYAAGAGGGPGLPGADGEPQSPSPPGPMGADDFGGAGGAAGYAIDGDSFVTLSGAGSVVGPTI
jgi:hypothetical protein